MDLKWPPEWGCLVDVLTRLGLTPLPPYIKRAATEDDVTRYQTVYARHHGSVAAPTAGLHFTPPLIDSMKARGCWRVRTFPTGNSASGTGGG